MARNGRNGTKTHGRAAARDPAQDRCARRAQTGRAAKEKSSSSRRTQAAGKSAARAASGQARPRIRVEPGAALRSARLSRQRQAREPRRDHHGRRFGHRARGCRAVRARRRRRRDRLSFRGRRCRRDRAPRARRRPQMPPIRGDVKDAAFCRRAVEQTVRKLGQLDVLVNNAAFQEHAASIEELSEDQFDLTMRTNIYGYFHMAKAAMPHLREGSAIIKRARKPDSSAHPSCSTIRRRKARSTRSRNRSRRTSCQGHPRQRGCAGTGMDTAESRRPAGEGRREVRPIERHAPARAARGNRAGVRIPRGARRARATSAASSCRSWAARPVDVRRQTRLPISRIS